MLGEWSPRTPPKNRKITARAGMQGRSRTSINFPVRATAYAPTLCRSFAWINATAAREAASFESFHRFSHR